MAKISHTPGPWEARGLTVFEPSKTALSVATATQHQPHAKANARLIAAAPDMLASLRAMVDFHAGERDGEYPDLDTARALIARLDGAS